MQVKALKQFTGPINMHIDEVKDIDDEVAIKLIAEGYVEEVYTNTLTYGDWSFNSTTGKEERTVSGKQAREHVNLTVTYNKNGGTGTTPSAQTVVLGTVITLNDGSGLTKSGKVFGGWATTNNAEEPDVTSPYTVTEDITLYAVWVAEE